MITDEDIKKLTKFQETVFVTKADLADGLGKLQDSFSTLQTAVESFA